MMNSLKRMVVMLIMTVAHDIDCLRLLAGHLCSIRDER